MGRIEPRAIRYGGAMFDQDEIDAVMAQLQNPMGLIPGVKVGEFEQRVADYMGKAHGVMVNSGSSALTIAMRLANLPLGSEVITPALTFSSGRRDRIVRALIPDGRRPPEPRPVGTSRR